MLLRPECRMHDEKEVLVSAQTNLLLMVMQAQGYSGYEIIRNVRTASRQTQEGYAEPILDLVY